MTWCQGDMNPVFYPFGWVLCHFQKFQVTIIIYNKRAAYNGAFIDVCTTYNEGTKTLRVS